MTSAHKGKRAENLVFSELLKREADIYIPLVDQGIDAIILKKDKSPVRIQVKATEKEFNNKCFEVDYLDPLDTNFFVVCVFLSKSKLKEEHEYWIVRADEYYKYATNNHRRLDIDASSSGHGNMPRAELLKHCKNAWDRLIGD